MKNLIFLLLLFFLLSCSRSNTIVIVPADQTVELDYPTYALFEATLNNKSSDGLEVSVLSKADDSQVRGFGLGKKAKADVIVERDNKLVFNNSTSNDIKLSINVREMETIKPSESRYINFTLRNVSNASIPLIIPSVMNPNLSPDSRSGVSLKIGQEIFFKVKRKKYLLFKVDESIKQGSEIEVSEYIMKRKKELGI